jgi:DUF2950 family protein
VRAAVADAVERAAHNQETDMKLANRILAAALACAFAGAVVPEALAQAASAPPAKKAAVTQRTFATPEEAATALAEAVRAKSVDSLLATVGPASAEWLFSGDSVADTNDWMKFLKAYDEKNSVDKQGDAKALLKVGGDDWPFPAPIVKRGAGWAFDTNAGREEIVNRRVGRNELDTIQTLLATVDAQREYAATDRA